MAEGWSHPEASRSHLSPGCMSQKLPMSNGNERVPRAWPNSRGRSQTPCPSGARPRSFCRSTWRPTREVTESKRAGHRPWAGCGTQGGLERITVRAGSRRSNTGGMKYRQMKDGSKVPRNKQPKPRGRRGHSEDRAGEPGRERRLEGGPGPPCGGTDFSENSWCSGVLA